MTDVERDTWTAHCAANVPPGPRLHPASQYQPGYHENFAADTRRVDPGFEIIRPFFGYAPADVVKNTFRATTQFARNVVRLPFRHHFKSRFPALNVRRRNEPVATDTVFSDVPSVVTGYKAAQVHFFFEFRRNDTYCLF